MLFVTISPKQAAEYSYIRIRLRRMLSKMSAARKTLEGIANTSFDKPFAKCVYLITSESLQCENEIRAHLDSLNCDNYNNEYFENKNTSSVHALSGLGAVSDYFEETYLNSYKKLLKDKHLGSSLKSLIQNHLQLLMSSLTQLRLFEDVKTVVN
jgi:hypothetical protein